MEGKSRNSLRKQSKITKVRKQEGKDDKNERIHPEGPMVKQLKLQAKKTKNELYSIGKARRYPTSNTEPPKSSCMLWLLF